MGTLVESGIKTTCPYCGVGCGIVATPDGKGGAAIAADHDHPANRGRLCSKGAALGETLSLEDRLLHDDAVEVVLAIEEAVDLAPLRLVVAAARKALHQLGHAMGASSAIEAISSVRD